MAGIFNLGPVDSLNFLKKFILEREKRKWGERETHMCERNINLPPSAHPLLMRSGHVP